MFPDLQEIARERAVRVETAAEFGLAQRAFERERNRRRLHYDAGERRALYAEARDDGGAGPLSAASSPGR